LSRGRDACRVLAEPRPALPLAFALGGWLGSESKPARNYPSWLDTGSFCYEGRRRIIEAEPLITVVVPAWDLGRELVDCVDSIISQDVSSRLVIVDNASDAELPSTPGKRLRLPRRVSVGTARNAGLTTVTTEYVFFMDGDDVLLPGTFGHLVEKLERDHRLVAAAGSILLWDPETDRRAPSYYPPAWAYRLQKWPQAFPLANVLANTFPAVGSTLVRTRIARGCGGFPDSNFLETWAFGLSLTLSGPVSLSERPCKLYRIGANPTSLKWRSIGRWQDARDGRREVRRRFLRQWRGRRGARLLLPLLVAAHSFQTLGELRRGEPRFADFLRSSGR
jgi:hypothetical protein